MLRVQGFPGLRFFLEFMSKEDSHEIRPSTQVQNAITTAPKYLILGYLEPISM